MDQSRTKKIFSTRHDCCTLPCGTSMHLERCTLKPTRQYKHAGNAPELPHSSSPFATMRPQLPPDIWYRIAGFSPPETLSSLSEVSTTLNKLVTDAKQFLRHISHTHLHPVQAFRREAALHHPPSTVSSTFKDIYQIFQANDTALLHDARNNSFIAFPKGHVFPLYYSNRLLVPSSYIPLRDELVGFVAASGNELCILDLSTGDFTSIPVKRADILSMKRRVALAGNRGEWLVQRINHKLIIIDFHTGETKHEYLIPDSVDAVLVMGEFSRSHDGTCVGYATTTLVRGVKTVIVYGFDGVNTTFQISEELAVESVLRSEDTLTHVLIARQENGSRIPQHFIASRGSMVWYGNLKDMHRPVLAGNGTLITESRLASPGQRPSGSAGSTVCIMLKDSGKQASWQTVQLKGFKRYSEIVWMRRIRGCIFTLVSGRGKDKLELVKISHEKERIREKVLKEWIIPDAKHIHMIADHYILAISESKELHLIHFDKFCNGVGGVYACSLVGLSTYCYFPGQFRGVDDVMREGKRRRIDDGMGDSMKWV